MTRRWLLFVFLMATMTALGTLRLAPGSDAPQLKGKAPTYENDIRPLFQAKCSKCHNDKVRKSDLDLSTPANILKGGESGRVVVPGKPGESPLYEKVHSGAMPPGKGNRLSSSEVETIKNWIASGATAATSAEPMTQHDVLPILMRHCTVCHGRHRQEARLDLRTRETLIRGGKTGPAIVPGKPDASLLIQKVSAGQMPPKDRLVEACVKPVDAAETEILVRWIAAGAPEVDVEPDIASTTPDTLVTDKDRDFWAFRSPESVVVPEARDANRVRNPIDAFLLKKLEEKRLTFSPEADRATLIRRASFDLTGLPPDPAEVRAFVADPAPDAYERLIERLLSSSCYGERWGRYWLDLAGYADSEGKREQDLPRPNSWRYRDYVIRAFNADKPFDRFLLEQIAGDELADYESATEITPEIYENLVATGFLRMAPDATWANITGYVPDRLEVIADEIDVLGSAVMGLTLKCARCHTHKFDPIPHRDYYRLAAIFKGALDENDWLKPDVRPGLGPMSVDVPGGPGGRLLRYVTTAERLDWEAHNKNAKEKLPEPKIHALWDRGEPTPTYIYRRGDPLSPGRLVGPGVPSVLTDGKTAFDVSPPWPGAKKTGRRLAFARWLTQPDHPLTARVQVNQIWKHHFGRGIVSTLGNFGKAGSPPTHPELLDWLAREFVGRGWSIKEMHRLMMTSTAYRQSSQACAGDSSLYPRMPLIRLDAEAIYDSLLVVAGQLDDRRYGPGDSVKVRPDGLATPAESERGWRRLVYVSQTRKQLPTHLEAFDYPQMNPNCIDRRDSTVAPQALYLMNNGMVDLLAERFAERVWREAASEPAARIERVYWLALSRAPSDRERQLGLAALKEFADHWASDQKSLKSFCRAIVNSAGFVYVD